MSDPFSVTGSAVGVVSLGLTICQGFLNYYGPWKTYDEEIRDFTSRVYDLQAVLQVLEALLSEFQESLLLGEFQGKDEDAGQNKGYQNLILGNLETCKQACQRLENMLKKCKANSISSEGAKMPDWLQLNRAKYPFRKGTLVSLSQSVTGFQHNLSMALQILHTVMASHQQKQLQELVLRASSIDVRTTQILSTVGRRTEPVSVRGLVDKQICIKDQAYSPTRVGSRCTCTRIPWGSTSAISFFALFRRERCLIHHRDQKVTTLGAKYTYCNKMFGLSLQIMMTLRQAAGEFSISPSLRMRCLVADDSPAFKLLADARRDIRRGNGNNAIYLEDTRRALLQMFCDGQASPTSILRDGSTLLHKLVDTFNTLDTASLSTFRCFVKDLIDAGVPLQEQKVNGTTLLDDFMTDIVAYKWFQTYYHSDTICLSFPEELYLIFSDMLISSSPLPSPTTMAPVTLFIYFGIIRRLIMSDVYEAHVFSDAELAALTRSEEGLLEYISTPPQPNLDTIINMCLGWPQGLSLILKSPLRAHIPHTKILISFVQACHAGDTECAMLLLEATDIITTGHLQSASRSERFELVDAVIMRIASQRKELQNLALCQMTSQRIRQLGLPSESLLDLRATNVYKALKIRPPGIDEYPASATDSVYSCILYNIDAANRLFEVGFTDLNQSNEDGLTAMMRFEPTHGAPRKDFFDILHFAQWMVSKGANLYQKSGDGHPAIYHLAEIVGYDIGSLWRRNSFRELRKRKSETSIELLHAILVDDTVDNCSCACSLGGCRPFTRLLRGSDRRWVDMNIDQLFNKIICWGSLGSSEPRLAEHVLRYFTFEKLGIKHTCHWKYVQMDEDEVEEIKQEERYNIATLGELLVEFNYKYKDSGLTLDKFLGGYWIDRMEEVLSGSSEIDPDEIRQVQEIGVVIVSEESGGEDEDGF